MPRIRTIKPEFPQSESMGNVSRDARLLFIQLWTLADDSGRLRGASRMLASLLFPYDEDAPGLMDTWLSELDREGCIVRYKHHTGSYIQVCNWLSHQKIDKPSPSKLPPYDESSRILANPRESSSLDLGPGRDLGSRNGEDHMGARETSAALVQASHQSLFKGLRDAFLSKTPTGFPDARKEVEALTWMSKACVLAWPEDPEIAAESLTAKFWEQTQTGSAFWKKQPFLPSRMKALFLDVVKACELQAGSSVDLNNVEWMAGVS